MTDIYTAPTNGHKIIRTSDDGLRINMPGRDYVAGHEPQTLLAGRVESLREYFRDERDKELGRWRSKKDPNYVVLKGNTEEEVFVLDERDGVKQWVIRGGKHGAERSFVAIAEEYFAEHPENKPWHDAKDGHLYLLNFKDEPNVDVSALVRGGMFVYNDPCCDGWDVLDSDKIKSARRIWPENKES